MTQEKINKVFQSDLGQQCDTLFTTADDNVFIRHEEAVWYTKNELKSDDFSTIEQWFEDYE